MSDQNLDPFVIVDEAGAPVGTIEDGDSGASVLFILMCAAHMCCASHVPVLYCTLVL